MITPLVLVAIAGLVAASPAATSTPVRYYVALGDSLATGTQPDSAGHNRATSQGYVDDLFAWLRRRNPTLKLVNLGCPGETTTSMIAGGRCHYSAGSQFGQALRFMDTHRSQVLLITVNIGDNDVERCVHGADSLDLDCAGQGMTAVHKNLPAIAAYLRAFAGRRVAIAGLADYDQFLSYWRAGVRGQATARQSVSLIASLNRAMDETYRRAGITAADAAGRFATQDLADMRSLPSSGRVPLAVARICQWTWACSGSPVGFNDHANRTGYRILADTLQAALTSGASPAIRGGRDTGAA